MKSWYNKHAARVAAIYAAVAFAWIAFSDRLAIYLAKGYADLAGFQTAKGLFFVSATSAILYFYTKHQFEQLTEAHAGRELQAKSALAEKEALLREVNHRVKNNLQVIVSLLNLHDDKDERFADLGSKVRSMALAHDLLTGSPDMASIKAGQFAARLAEVLGSDSSSVRISGLGDDSSLSADAAVAAGILIAEACSNAARHARGPAGEPARATITIRGDRDGTIVTVRDDGPGFPDRPGARGAAPGRAAAEMESLGLTLMAALAEQVRGTLVRRNEGGAVVELRMPNVPPLTAYKR